jgi:serine/threonine protein kinase
VPSERWEQVTEIFHAALASDPARRGAFLSDACGGDAALRAEVEALVAAHDEAGLFGEVPLFVPALSLEPGSSFGPYRIEELLGAGGMGEVYRARDDALERDVAIKVLPRHFESAPEPIARLGREARLLAALSHPHIAAIYGMVEAGACRGLVLEFVEGPTLADRLAAGSLPLDDALRIAHQIAEALEAAHEKGVTHRDLKPANIKITPDGAVKVLDFGLAKAVRDDSSAPQAPGRPVDKTIDGALLGTAAYMSPEQARGHRVDKRTDIWAFGCVLYEMLTGHQAFDADTVPDTLLKVLEREPDWGLLPGAVPDAIRKLLRRCLSKDRAARLHDIADARLDIAETIELGPAQRLELPTQRAPRVSWTSRRIILAAMSGSLVVIVGALTIFGKFVDHSDLAWRNPLENAQFTRLTDFPGTETDAAISPDGRFVVFVADRDGPRDIFLTQVGTGRFINLTHGDEPLQTSIRSVGFSGDGSEVWLHRDMSTPVRTMPLMGGKPRAFLGPGSQNVAWTPDGTRMVYHTSDPGDPMFVAEQSGNNAREIFVSQPDTHNHFPAWSPDGQWIYFASGNPIVNEMDLWRLPSRGGMPQQLTHHNSFVAYPTPIDRTTVLYVARDGSGGGPWLWALDVERKETRRISIGVEKFSSIAASADGRRLVAAVGDPSAALWSVPILDRVAGESDVKPYPLPTIRALMPRFGADSLFYLSSRGAGDGLWRYQNGEAQEIWKGATGALLEPPAVSADGRVAIVLRRNGSPRLHVETGEGTEPKDLLAGTLAVRGTPSWSPDGKWIVIGGHDGQGDGLFKIPVDGGAPVRIASGPAANPVWAPDGTLILYAGADVGGFSPLLAVRPDGTRTEWPHITVERDGERIRFLPGGKALIYMQGYATFQDFWILDMATKSARQLTHFTPYNTTMRTFDITPDGKQIVFDRLRENSDIVLIDLPK